MPLSIIQAVINFVLIVLVIFFTLRAVVAVEKEIGMQKKEQEKPETEPKPSDEVKLLTEIRDLMKENSAMANGD
jgi:large conductance mechanosensitive channel